jgi:hypothetical protein
MEGGREVETGGQSYFKLPPHFFSLHLETEIMDEEGEGEEVDGLIEGGVGL